MNDKREQALQQYRELLARLEAKFAEIRATFPGEFQCRLGCHSCCKPNLSVSPVEAEALRSFLRERPSLVEDLASLEQTDPHSGKRCRFLSAAGACSVYEARPMVCRSHGAPLQMRPLEKQPDENLRLRDVCPLNFTNQDVMTLPPEAVLNLDTLNALLALLNKLGFPDPELRTPLRLHSLIES